MSDSRRQQRRDKRREKQRARFRDIVQDPQGNVIYTGTLHHIEGDESVQRAARIKMLALLILTGAFVISSGCIDSGGAMGAFYVILPYIGEVSSLFVLAWTSVKLFVPYGIRTYVLQHSGERLLGACRMLTIFAIAGMMLSVVYLIRNGMGGESVKNTLYLGLKLAAAAGAEIYRRLFSSLEWDEV